RGKCAGVVAQADPVRARAVRKDDVDADRALGEARARSTEEHDRDHEEPEEAKRVHRRRSAEEARARELHWVPFRFWFESVRVRDSYQRRSGALKTERALGNAF